MSRTLKIVTTVLWGLTVATMVAFVASRHTAPAHTAAVESSEALPILYDAPPFSLTNQNGKTVTDQDMRGSVWIADFVFTHCAGPCPEMSGKMAQLQKTIADPRVKFVSFSVDPERDTPAVLKEYSTQLGADESRWSFLTGPMDSIFAVASGMHLTALAATGDNPIIHDERFLLIDAAGRVRGIYHSKNPEKMNKLPADAAALSAGGVTP